MQKGFFVVSTFDVYAACIKINTETHANDTFLADLLNLSHSDYMELLISYGAYDSKIIGFVFDSKYDAQAFVDYLNEKYLPMLALIGKI